MKSAIVRKALEYLLEDGSSPYSKWLKSLRDTRAKAKIVKATSKMQVGNFGDHKSVGEGVFEHRINYGPGYRIYYALDGEELIILFCGGDKSTQQVDIGQAKGYWADYKRRKKSGLSKTGK